MIKNPSRRCPQILIFSCLLFQTHHHQHFIRIFRIFDSKPNGPTTRSTCSLSAIETPGRPQPIVFSSRQTGSVVIGLRDPAQAGHFPNGIAPCLSPSPFSSSCHVHLAISKSTSSSQSHPTRFLCRNGIASALFRSVTRIIIGNVQGVASFASMTRLVPPLQEGMQRLLAESCVFWQRAEMKVCGLAHK